MMGALDRPHRLAFNLRPMTEANAQRPRLAVLIPCFNEEAAIGKVVRDFRAALPDAAIYVYDNNSSDGTTAAAREAGAIVRRETLQGKGHVVRRMFADVDADIYVLVDGDDTYDAAAAPEMVRSLLDEQLDMVNGARVTEIADAYRRGHRLGNAVLSGIVRWIFGNRLRDMLSGYRVFSRRFVKSFPALAAGFETETEFTIHALELKMPVAEVPVAYKERAEGSLSKLRTYSDGIRILRTIVVLVKEERPLQFFAVAALVLFLLGIGFGIPVVLEFLQTGLVPRLPTAVLATGLVLLSFLALVCGLVLDSVARGRKEIKRLAYLAIPAVGANG
jgi:glycosyltransferase involved in cell wall biosynthesis